MLDARNHQGKFGADVLSYRLRLPRFGDVPFTAGLRAVRAARAAARDLAEPERRTSPGRLLDRTALSTARDGFGLDVLVPVLPDGFGRATTLRVLRASTAVLDAAGSPDPAAWHDLPRFGLVDDVCGTLVVDGDPAGRECAVRVRVDDPETYLLAIEAHRAGDDVRAEGAVESMGTRYGIAVEPSGFTVVDRGRG